MPPEKRNSKDAYQWPEVFHVQKRIACRPEGESWKVITWQGGNHDSQVLQYLRIVRREKVLRMMGWTGRRSLLKYMNTLGGGSCAVIRCRGVRQPAVRTIGMAAKWVSRVRRTEPVSRAPAAIQTSLVGIEVLCSIRYFMIVTK